MYLPLKCRMILVGIFLLLNITETLTVSLVQDSPAVDSLAQYDESYFRPDQITLDLRPPSNLSRDPGPSAAASNRGGIVRWENNTQRFSWRRKRQIVGRRAHCNSMGCCGGGDGGQDKC